MRHIFLFAEYCLGGKLRARRQGSAIEAATGLQGRLVPCTSLARRKSHELVDLASFVTVTDRVNPTSRHKLSSHPKRFECDNIAFGKPALWTTRSNRSGA